MKKVAYIIGIIVILTFLISANTLEVYRDNHLIGNIESTLLSNAVYFSLSKLQSLVSDISFTRNTNDLNLQIFNQTYNFNFLNNLLFDKSNNKIYDGANEVRIVEGDVLVSNEILNIINKNIDNISINNNQMKITSSLSSSMSLSNEVDIIGQMLTKKKESMNKVNIIVIDAGHGGTDPGAIGYNDIKEKDIVLSTALKLRKHLLRLDPLLKVYLTREDDRFIPLFRRTEIANKSEADLFISLHANAGYRENAQGFETYYYHFKTDESTKIIERIENSVINKYETDIDVDKTFIDIIKQDMIQIQFINESRNLAMMIQKFLDYNLNSINDYRIMNRGIKRAKFLVLQYALMPSVLIELGFISNKKEALLLTNNDYQEMISESIARAIINYKEEYELR